MNKNKTIVLGVVIVAVSIAAVFYILNSKKTISSTPSDTYRKKPLVVLEKPPSETFKEYFDNSGFKLKYPDDVQIDKIEIKDNIIYSNLELTSNQAKGKILIKIVDTQLKSIDDWFARDNFMEGNKKEIKIGEISGVQLQMDNKILAAAINQKILFTIEVDAQSSKYWQSVYRTMLSTFSFVPQTESVQIQDQSLDDPSSDVVLEEEIVE